jgi:hypothetical protein
MFHRVSVRPFAGEVNRESKLKKAAEKTRFEGVFAREHPPALDAIRRSDPTPSF